MTQTKFHLGPFSTGFGPFSTGFRNNVLAKLPCDGHKKVLDLSVSEAFS